MYMKQRKRANKKKKREEGRRYIHVGELGRIGGRKGEDIYM